MKIGDTVEFVDKTGELLTGKVFELEFQGDPTIISVTCFKKSWGMEIGCLVLRKHCKVISSGYTLSCEQYFEIWMESTYPHRGYVNSLSNKWTIRFAKDYHEYLNKKANARK